MPSPRRIVAILTAAAAVHGCGGAPAAKDGQTQALAAAFAGAESAEKTADGSWVVHWTAVEADGLVYSVFRAAADEGFNYQSPFATTQLDFFKYKPRNTYIETSRCFAVRVTSVEGDDNTASACIDAEALSYTGATNLERQGDGGYLLKWDDVDVDGVVFAVYERQDGDEFNFEQPSYDGISENFFKLPRFDRGTRYCFVVRYVQAELPPDENTQELCTDAEPEIQFAGIRDLVAEGPKRIKLTWLLAGTSEVKSYRVYQGSDFKELVATAAAGVGSATVDGLVPGRQYSFGVRAVDEFGREDRNIRIRSIVMPSE